MSTELLYDYKDNGSNKLLIAISDMGSINLKKFQSYKTYSLLFTNYNILFIREQQLGCWYINHINELKDKINTYAHKHVATYMISSSSAGFISLHLIPSIMNIHKVIFINIQFFLNEDMNKYDDLYHLDISKLNVNNNLLYPMNNFPNNLNCAIRYYSSDTNSDGEFAQYLESLSLPQFIIIKEGHLNLNHYEYIKYKLKYTETNKFFDEILNFFEN